MARRYRDRVTIKRDSSSAGDETETYVNFLASVPCNIIPRSGQESYRGVQLEASTSHVIDTRYYDGIVEDMIADNDLTSARYFITSVLDVDNRSRWLMIQATEKKR